MLVAFVVGGCGRIGFDDLAELTTYRDAVLADAPVGYWRLGDPKAIARDETGIADGAYTGGCARGAAGALADDPDGAVRFDGATCRITLLDRYGFFETQPFSVEVWVQLATIGGFQHFFMNERRDATDPIDGYALLESPSGVYFERVTNFSNRATSIFDIAPGAFVHLVGVHDGTQNTLYVDGAPLAPRQDAAAMASFAGEPLIGASVAGIGFVDGVLDEIAVYDHALSPERIAVHHQIGVLGPISK